MLMPHRCSPPTRTSGASLTTRLKMYYLSYTYLWNIRFMGLNDLMNEIKQDQASFVGDEPTENKVLKQVLALVEDKISEVKNQAVKWQVSITSHARRCGYLILDE